jgi:DHA2 family multidrug resistance protein
MSADASRTATPAANRGAGANPWLIAVLVAFAAFMEVLDTTIANVALPYIAGGLGVSEDEASWVVTTYLVANAISLTGSSFFAQRFGRKSFFLICLVLFTASSVLCGFAPNLPSLLLFRILQGLGGGGMVPVSQSILASAFPPEKRGQGFALFGIAVVVAPVVGPTLGGWIADNFSWQWCFLINGPVGVVAIGLISSLLRESKTAVAERMRFKQQGRGFELVGFVLVATFLGTLEIALDRGPRGRLVCLKVYRGRGDCLRTRLRPDDPLGTQQALRMVATRQFGASFIVMLAAGAILLATTQFLPQLVQQNFGYTATLAGSCSRPAALPPSS